MNKINNIADDIQKIKEELLLLKKENKELKRRCLLDELSTPELISTENIINEEKITNFKSIARTRKTQSFFTLAQLAIPLVKKVKYRGVRYLLATILILFFIFAFIGSLFFLLTKTGAINVDFNHWMVVIANTWSFICISTTMLVSLFRFHSIYGYLKKFSIYLKSKISKVFANEIAFKTYIKKLNSFIKEKDFIVLIGYDRTLKEQSLCFVFDTTKFPFVENAYRQVGNILDDITNKINYSEHINSSTPYLPVSCECVLKDNHYAISLCVSVNDIVIDSDEHLSMFIRSILPTIIKNSISNYLETKGV